VVVVVVALVVGRMDSTPASDAPTADNRMPASDDTRPPADGTGELRALYERSKATLPVHDLACFPRTSAWCDDGKCETFRPGEVFVLAASRPKPTLSRCDAKGCDTYPAVQVPSGNIMNYQPKEPRGFVLKVDLSQMKYVEVTTLETRALVNHGACAVMREGGARALVERALSAEGEGWWCWHEQGGNSSECRRTYDDCERSRASLASTARAAGALLWPCARQPKAGCVDYRTRLENSEVTVQDCTATLANCARSRSVALADPDSDQVSDCTSVE
jgi:hypothetical protein